jgi:hypothetical protein
MWVTLQVGYEELFVTNSVFDLSAVVEFLSYKEQRGL